MFAPVLNGRSVLLRSYMQRTHFFINTSALLGSVNISPVISRTPASPPSNRPSSTSVEIPWALQRLMKGTAMAMFSSSV